ncbi:hypothetical protein [Streptomyces violaceoruber]|uniref:hypothetical protein n=1 Tax=Streptomyces violaceoruber TaxID=1935 RepID=UPI003B434198
MPTETERKYPVSADDPRRHTKIRETRTLRQSCLPPGPTCEIQIRAIDDTAAYLDSREVRFDAARFNQDGTRLITVRPGRVKLRDGATGR